MNCDGVINLQAPTGRERRRGFQPPWYTVFKYKCPKCGATHTVRANSFLGARPVPSTGGIVCGVPMPETRPTIAEVKP